ncbi:hypothetical protein Pla110_12660 [Polystyrenella longa]|uniref:Gamma-glutamylcyclotransferase AIG2-like domain-containing protein n=1 Tax=Polystyrenella longa TaxID=2528007 RepID=A0A518CJZ7_9PLAN|nr:gamma-glutamylcyclotransferase family protein [Polystyrenella longa]QDU79555.1 hypothetical protein Pla110_12660 [Polystyrenella longa]
MAANNADLELLFVYGLLQPGHRFPAGAEPIQPDRVRGLLYDLGDYPAAIDIDIDLTESWFEGYLIAIPPEMFFDLDQYECVDEGLYRRIQTETESGKCAWVYEYLKALPYNATGPITKWPMAL